jgi:hypothetical protein
MSLSLSLKPWILSNLTGRISDSGCSKDELINESINVLRRKGGKVEVI